MAALGVPAPVICRADDGALVVASARPCGGGRAVVVVEVDGLVVREDVVEAVTVDRMRRMAWEVARECRALLRRVGDVLVMVSARPAVGGRMLVEADVSRWGETVGWGPFVPRRCEVLEAASDADLARMAEEVAAAERATTRSG